MMNERKDTHQYGGELGVPLAQVEIRVPGVNPNHFDERGDVRDHKMRKKITSFLLDSEKNDPNSVSKINWDHVIKKVDSGELNGRFIVTSSAIIITLALAGIEIGRHGEDVKKILNLVKRHKKRENQLSK